jgi:hypothetical protein
MKEGGGELWYWVLRLRINCWGRSWRWCSRRVNMRKKNGGQWCVLGKRGRMCDHVRDSRCDRRCTRGVKGR